MKIDKDFFIDNFFGYRKDRLPITLIQEKKIKSCERCEGTGRTSREELVDYHKRDYETIREDCNACFGEGRLVVTTVSLSFGDIPYGSNVRSDNIRNAVFQVTQEPCSKEKMKGLEDKIVMKTFDFLPEHIQER